MGVNYGTSKGAVVKVDCSAAFYFLHKAGGREGALFHAKARVPKCVRDTRLNYF